jgi:heat-inducible transcriptional repressor
MKTTNLSQREQKILRAAVNHYIATAEPVGSKVLAEAYDFDLSAATIRNVLGVLDRSGLLYQPHISAGRVPSHYGYRVYVDQLIQPSSQPQLERQIELTAKLLNQKLSQADQQNLETLLRGATQVLATLSGCIAIVTAPDHQPLGLRHIHLLAIADQKVVVTGINDSYHTASVVVDLPTHISSSELERLNNFLNAHLSDRSTWELEQLLASLQWQELDQQMYQYADFLEQSLRQISQIYRQPKMGQLFISGLAELMQQPEFNQLSQVVAIIRLLEEEQTSLIPLMAETLFDHGITIKIGNEIKLESIRNCTLISAIYKVEQQHNSTDQPISGTVGLLGPTRLNYEQAIASVQATATHLAEAISLQINPPPKTN